MAETTASRHQQQKRLYLVQVDCLPLYDSPACIRLATQAWSGRLLWLPTTLPSPSCSISVTLCEDLYDCWLSPNDLQSLSPLPPEQSFCRDSVSPEEIRCRIGSVLDFVWRAYRTPNHYLWGGTVGPHFDCSGLVQRAFSSAGIWIPRDAYQQESFVQKVCWGDAEAGDLVFFGKERATHVGIILEQRATVGGQWREFLPGNNSNSAVRNVAPPLKYMHCSGEEHGHGRIEIDILAINAGDVATHCYVLFRGFGRVVKQCS